MFVLTGLSLLLLLFGLVCLNWLLVGLPVVVGGFVVVWCLGLLFYWYFSWLMCWFGLVFCLVFCACVCV